MAFRLKRTLLRPIPYLFSDRAGLFIIRHWTRDLKEELCGMVTGKFLELLLTGMDLAFCLSRGYRKNIEGFKGRYLFRTANDLVAKSATFERGNMEVHPEAIEDWDVRITFKDTDSLKSYIFSQDQDVLDSLLKNDVEVDGNLNYIFKFGFMARDLGRRLGVG